MADQLGRLIFFNSGPLSLFSLFLWLTLDNTT